jgi:hypothetical protein
LNNIPFSILVHGNCDHEDQGGESEQWVVSKETVINYCFWKFQIKSLLFSRHIILLNGLTVRVMDSFKIIQRQYTIGTVGEIRKREGG